MEERWEGVWHGPSDGGTRRRRKGLIDRHWPLLRPVARTLFYTCPMSDDPGVPSGAPSLRSRGVSTPRDDRRAEAHRLRKKLRSLDHLVTDLRHGRYPRLQHPGRLAAALAVGWRASAGFRPLWEALSASGWRSRAGGIVWLLLEGCTGRLDALGRESLGGIWLAAGTRRGWRLLDCASRRRQSATGTAQHDG